METVSHNIKKLKGILKLYGLNQRQYKIKANIRSLDKKWVFVLTTLLTLQILKKDFV